MIKIIDFSNYPLSSRDLSYGGRAGEKRGIIYNNEFWFLKFPKNTIGMNKVEGLSYVTSPLSEFIGSNIYKILGYDTHETILGVCNDGKRYKVVCACRDFITDDRNELLIPYTALRNDTNPLIMERSDDETKSPSNINDIIFQLENNTVLSSIEEAEKRFWDVVIIDMIINNNDRNEDNWGVIKYKNENRYRLAPIFDCGNSFYSKTSEDRIIDLLNDDVKLVSSAINGITAYEDDDEKRITNLEMINYLKKYASKNIKDVCDRIRNHLNEIKEFIDSIPSHYNDILIISDNRKEYYFKTIKIRLDQLVNSIIEIPNENTYDGLKKRRLQFIDEKKVVIYKVKMYCDYLCLYPDSIRMENTSVMPSVVHFENKSYNSIPRDEFDSFEKIESNYLKIFLVKGVKRDIFIHPNGKAKTLINPEDEVNGIHIIKEEELDNFIKNIGYYKEKYIYKI